MAFSLTSMGTTNGVVSVASQLNFPSLPAVPAGALIVVIYGESNNSPGDAIIAADSWNNNRYGESSFGTGNKRLLANGSAGTLWVGYYWNSLPVAAGVGNLNIRNETSASRNLWGTAFYVTGASTTSDPWDTAFFAALTGNSAIPSVTAAAPTKITNSLVVGALFFSNHSAFTQDSTHASYATPPDLNQGTDGATLRSIGGGSVVSSSKLTYAPTIGTSTTWIDAIMAFSPDIPITLKPPRQTTVIERIIMV